MEVTTTIHDDSLISAAILVCNLLQAIDMSIRFILYCFVNSHFRRLLRERFYCFCKSSEIRPPVNVTQNTRLEEIQLNDFTSAEL